VYSYLKQAAFVQEIEVNKSAQRKVIVFVLILATLTSFLGCSGSTSKQQIGQHEIVRDAVLNTTWQLYQIRVTLDAGSQFDVLLTLTDADRVDGYFYSEKGTGAILRVRSGSNIVYQSQPAGESKNLPSDRFSFTANQGQGNTYVLNLTNANTDNKSIVFLEILYPATASIYIPLESK